MQFVLVCGLLIVSIGGDRLTVPESPVKSVHFEQFYVETGGAVDELFLFERGDQISLTPADQVAIRKLLADCVPSDEPIDRDVLRLRIKFETGELLFADRDGRVNLYSGERPSPKTFELSAPAFVLLSDVLTSKLDRLVFHEDDSHEVLPGIPIPPPIQYKAPVKPFSEKVAGVPTRIHARKVFHGEPALASESELRSNRAPIVLNQDDQLRILDLFSRCRADEAGIDSNSLWFVAEYENGVILRADRYGRLEVAVSKKATPRRYAMTASDFRDLDHLLDMAYSRERWKRLEGDP